MIGLFHRLCKGRLFHHPRGEIRFVDYAEGDRLIRTGEWELAIPEEDTNHVFNRVYIERITKS